MTSTVSQKNQSILTCDKEEGLTILHTPSPYLEEKDWDKAQSTADTLLYVRMEIIKRGAGLAAPQIGLNDPIFIYTPDRTPENLRVVINPTFEPVGDECVEGTEACFSEPLRCVKLNRWKKIKVRYQTLEKEWVEDVLEDFAAKVFQHETDHIQGKLLMDEPSGIITTFSNLEDFEAHMTQVMEEDSKTYTKK